MVRHGQRRHAPERENERPPGSRCWAVDRDQQEIHDPAGERQGERLVRVLRVEEIELRTGGVDEDGDAPRPRGAAHSLGDEEDGENEHDAGGNHDDELRQHQRKSRDPLRRRREELQTRVVRAYRQQGVGRKEAPRVDHPRQGREVEQFVESVEDERAANDVGAEEPDAEDERDLEMFASRGLRAGEPPGAWRKDRDETEEEQRQSQGLVPEASQRVAHALSEEPEPDDGDDGPETRRPERVCLRKRQRPDSWLLVQSGDLVDHRSVRFTNPYTLHPRLTIPGAQDDFAPARPDRR